MGDECVQAVKVQLLAHNAIEVTADETEMGTANIYWLLTATGRQLMLEAGVHRTER
jgi:hypothetical protein